MSLTYCADLVRQQDPDRFLLGLLAPRRVRSALMALYAFHYEIAKTREVVSDTRAGLIRLTWWREAIEEIYAGKAPRAHEGVQGLAQAVHDYGLPKEDFDTLILGREFDLEDAVPGSLQGLKLYCEQTCAPLTRLALQVAGEEEDVSVVHDASVNYALVGLLRAVSYFRAQRRCYLPDDILRAHDLPPEKFFDFNPKETLPPVIKEIIAGMNPYRKGQSRTVRAMQALTHLYVRQIEAVGYDVFDPRLAAPPRFKELRVSLRSLL